MSSNPPAMSRDTEIEQTPRSNPNTQPGCSWAARSVQTCKVDVCPLAASMVISSYQPRSPLSVHSWQRGFQVVIPIRSHSHLSPSSYTGGAPTKISKILALSSPMSLLTRDASKTHGQRLARMVLGWLVFMPPTIALCLPIHVRGALFPLTQGVEALGEGEWGKIAEKPN